MSAALARLKELQAKIPAKAPTLATLKSLKSPFEPFEGERGGHVGPDGAAATSVEPDKVPACYAAALARLQFQTLPGIPPDWQSRAADMASMLLDRHGAALLRLGWPVGAMFDSPVVLGTFGESAALDLRKAGLAWQMRQGDTITKLAPNGAVILRADSKTWPFLFTPAQGARPFFDCGPT